MGVNIGEILPSKEIDIKDLYGKVIAIDASLFLYQFVTTIRQQDGQPLMDSKGNITSHLSGVFFRTINLIQKGLKLVYIFDGKPPELKDAERKRRSLLKEDAQEKYEKAVEEENIELMKRYASRTVKLTPEMIEETKELLVAMGVPIVESPSEAEAQGAYMVKKGDCYAIATQDSDVLMFGTSRLIKNLSLLGKRKKINAYTYNVVKPELITLADTLNNFGIEHDQFIIIGGIKGVGPKKALKLIKQYGNDFEMLFKDLKWQDYFSYSWSEVFYTIKKISVKDDYLIKWGKVNTQKVIEIMVDKHEFSRERIENMLSQITSQAEHMNQKSLFDF
jgi:flap endonuclease-1